MLYFLRYVEYYLLNILFLSKLICIYFAVYNVRNTELMYFLKQLCFEQIQIFRHFFFTYFPNQKFSYIVLLTLLPDFFLYILYLIFKKMLSALGKKKSRKGEEKVSESAQSP